MHRWTPWWLAIGVIVAVAGTACTSASGSGKSTVLASAEPAGSGAAGSAVSSAAIGATVFTCPSAAEINSLTAMGFTAAVGNGTDHCEYVVTTGSTQAVRVSINHPPASATSAGQTLPQFRAAIVAAGNVVLTTAPQYSTDSFIARFGTLSCSVFALARDAGPPRRLLARAIRHRRGRYRHPCGRSDFRAGVRGWVWNGVGVWTGVWVWVGGI
jgi:hypothetical protein